MTSTTETRFLEPGSVNVPVGRLPPGEAIKLQIVDARSVVLGVIKKLNESFQNHDAKAIATLFYEDGYWRDHLALSWKLRTLKGRGSIQSVLEEPKDNLMRIYLDESSEFRAVQYRDFGGVTILQFFHKFSTKFGAGQGVANLISINSEWKIWTMFTSLQEIVGGEERVGISRPDGHEQLVGGKNWLDVRKQEAAFDSKEPVVLIIGAGQAGLTLSARLKMLNVVSLCIDTNITVGDNWRKRYHDLVLHDPVWYDHLPYLPFPASWPIFTPKDKLADFFEAYVKVLELNVWMQAHLKESAWDEDTKKWTVTLETVDPSTGDAQTRVLRPLHIVQATGQSGQKKMPIIQGADKFTGAIIHSSEFKGADQADHRKSVVVIGACNSAHDICHDFYNKGYNVTMIQRSSTTVVSPASMMQTSFAGLYEENGPPAEDADLLIWSMPAEIAKLYSQVNTQAQMALDAPLLDGLRKAGFKLNSGPDNAGIYMSYLQRGGGYYIDVGTSRLIIEGKIKVKSGSGVSHILPHGIVLADGTELLADTIVFATGYQNMRSETQHIFGNALADKLEDVWGYDSEGEIRGMWRRTSHPGFWYMGGNLSLCRYYSRILAVQIKAAHAGLADGN